MKPVQFIKLSEAAIGTLIRGKRIAVEPPFAGELIEIFTGIDRNPLPADQSSYGRFTELYELNRLHLKEILDANAAPTSMRTPNEQKIGDEYASCMDAAAIDK